MRNKTLFIGVGVGVVIGLLLAAAGIALAGGLNPPAGPGESSSQMYTLEQLYQRLTTGNYYSKQSEFSEPASGPGWTMHTLDQIMALAQPRALANRVAKTGQTQIHYTYDDGYYQYGIDPAVAPTCCDIRGAYNTPMWTGVRFTDNGDGTVTDNLTGLIWLKNANCFSPLSWQDALNSAHSLTIGACGLTDSPPLGYHWRLPNVNELHSLIDFGHMNPALSLGYPFTGVKFCDSCFYWTSTSYSLAEAWIVTLYDGLVYYANKGISLYLWPVRGGT
jgi:hypothetical protein